MTPTSTYLTAYNTLSCTLWAYLTFHTLLSLPTLHANQTLHQLYHDLLFPLLAGTQSLAVLEIFHAATGLVRASPLTTAIQVVGKNLVVWTVMVAFPEIVVGRDGRGGASGVWPFFGCVLFWGISEVVRYGYFVVLLVAGEKKLPGWLKWLRYAFLCHFTFTLCSRFKCGFFSLGWGLGTDILRYRYSAFIVLYPPGLISEAWLVWLALTETTGVSLPYRAYLLLGFLTYIPGELEKSL
jgi:very-long-chain (3R)-3-hydroxyacyl-CoA dehydratase